MTLTDIFAATAEEMTTAQKLEELKTIVAAARTAYGNEDAEIPEPEVNTVDGLRKLSYVSPEGKVACANTAFNTIKNVVIEHHAANPGIVLDKEIESLLATDPTLCNLGSTVKSSYL